MYRVGKNDCPPVVLVSCNMCNIGYNVNINLLAAIITAVGRQSFLPTLYSTVVLCIHLSLIHI